MSCIEDILDTEGFMDQVVGINLPKVLCNNRLNAGVEPPKEGGVVLAHCNVMVQEKGVANS